ncbi:hypothetical protein B0H13DRAFT_1863890 [Mycena leptocephala]|nr:hypothetical protein B0H13DRAFT_1863890 [Mycena leptocephala]
MEGKMENSRTARLCGDSPKDARRRDVRKNGGENGEISHIPAVRRRSEGRPAPRRPEEWRGEWRTEKYRTALLCGDGPWPRVTSRARQSIPFFAKGAAPRRQDGAKNGGKNGEVSHSPAVRRRSLDRSDKQGMAEHPVFCEGRPTPRRQDGAKGREEIKTFANKMFAHGGTSDGRCASFFSPNPVWNMRMTCICGLPWAANAVLAQLPGASTLVPHRPVTAFAGLACPTTASVYQRPASIQRTLHPNEPSSSISSAVSPTKQRNSGPPRLFSDTPATLSSLTDFAPPPVVSWVPVTCVILAKVLDTSDYNDTLDLSPRYSWKGGDDLENAQNALSRPNIVFGHPGKRPDCQCTPTLPSRIIVRPTTSTTLPQYGPHLR